MRVLRILALILVLIIPIAAIANPFCQIPESERSATDNFGCKTSQVFFVCGLNSRLAFAQWQLKEKTSEESINEVNVCIRTSIDEVEPLFKKAKSELSGNSGGLEAIKDLYSYWLASMDLTVLLRSPTEPESLFEARLNQRSTGISERVNRLKAEL